MNYLYIKNRLLYEDGKIKNETFDFYIKTETEKHFRSLSSIRKSIRSIFGIKKNQPLYISKTLFLFPISLKDVKYYINYYSIKNVTKTDLGYSFIFNDLSSLTIKISDYKYKMTKRNVRKICDYISLID